MAITRKRSFLRQFNLVDVYKEDTDNSIFKLDVPTEINLGKSYFTIEGSSYLKNLSNIKIEVLDSDNKPLYVERQNYYINDKIFVTIWVAEDDSIGKGTITLLGELTDVPDEWKDIYNVKLVKEIYINPKETTSSEIIFKNRPTVSVVERITAYNEIDNDDLIAQELNSTVSVEKYNNFDLVTKKNFLLNEEQLYKIHITSGEVFSGDISSGYVVISNPNYNVSSSEYEYSEINEEIYKIIDEHTFLIKTKIELLNKQTNKLEEVEVNNSAAQIFYYTVPSPVTSSKTLSLAQFNIDNLETISGVVKNIKVFYKSLIKQDDYNELSNIPVNSRNKLIVDEVNLGNIISQSHIDNNYTIIDVDPSGVSELRYNKTKFYNSIQTIEEGFIIELNEDMSFTKNNSYIIQSDIYCEVPGEIDIYIKGSSVYDDNSYGKLIGTLHSSGVKIFDNEEFLFTAENTSVFNKLRFHIKSGSWYIRDISIRKSNLDGTNPNSVQFSIPLRTSKENEPFVFKIQYIDYTNKLASFISNINIPIIFNGVDDYIETGNQRFFVATDNGKVLFNTSDSLTAEAARQSGEDIIKIDSSDIYNYIKLYDKNDNLIGYSKTVTLTDLEAEGKYIVKIKNSLNNSVYDVVEFIRNELYDVTPPDDSVCDILAF